MDFGRAVGDAAAHAGRLPRVLDLLTAFVARAVSAPVEVEAARAALGEGLPAPPPRWEEALAAARGPTKGTAPQMPDGFHPWAKTTEILLCRLSTHLVRLRPFVPDLSEDEQVWFTYLSTCHAEHRHADRIAMGIHYRAMGRPDLAEQVEAMPIEQLMRDRRCMDDLERD